MKCAHFGRCDWGKCSGDLMGVGHWHTPNSRVRVLRKVYDIHTSDWLSQYVQV